MSLADTKPVMLPLFGRSTSLRRPRETGIVSLNLAGPAGVGIGVHCAKCGIIVMLVSVQVIDRLQSPRLRPRALDDRRSSPVFPGTAGAYTAKASPAEVSQAFDTSHGG